MTNNEFYMFLHEKISDSSKDREDILKEIRDFLWEWLSYCDRDDDFPKVVLLEAIDRILN